eukprot:1148485-Rhodomonas_salina.1
MPAMGWERDEAVGSELAHCLDNSLEPSRGAALCRGAAESRCRVGVTASKEGSVILAPQALPRARATGRQGWGPRPGKPRRGVAACGWKGASPRWRGALSR